MKNPYCLKLSIVFIGSMFLGSAVSASRKVQVKGPESVNYSITVPAYSIISDVINDMIPLFNNQKNPILMQLICQASGPGVNNSLRDVFLSQKIDLEKIKPSKKAVELLDSGTKSDLRNACVAWIASTTSDIVNTGIWMDAKKVTESVSEVITPKGWKFWQKDEIQKKEIVKDVQVLNAKKFSDSAADRLTVAQANADLYGFIISNLNRESILSFSQYHGEIARLIDAYGERYFKKIQFLQGRSENQQYTGRVTGENSFTFSDSYGALYEQHGSIFSLSIDGIDWLGNGKILGQNYYLKIDISEN
ncbi:hypothetical protein RX799_24495 [Klebsiella oxytoca]|uniref:hypothetical protein n=1 Tax=Klebsiella oxytoca TaxID=571 RepID=UPI00384F6612